MAPKGYKEVREGVYESDDFMTSDPKIDSERILQILNEQRPASENTADEATRVSIWDSEHSVQQSNEHTGA